MSWIVRNVHHFFFLFTGCTCSGIWAQRLAMAQVLGDIQWESSCIKELALLQSSSEHRAFLPFVRTSILFSCSLCHLGSSFKVKDTIDHLVAQHLTPTSAGTMTELRPVIKQMRIVAQEKSTGAALLGVAQKVNKTILTDLPSSECTNDSIECGIKCSPPEVSPAVCRASAEGNEVKDGKAFSTVNNLGPQPNSTGETPATITDASIASAQDEKTSASVSIETTKNVLKSTALKNVGGRFENRTTGTVSHLCNPQSGSVGSAKRKRGRPPGRTITVQSTGQIGAMNHVKSMESPQLEVNNSSKELDVAPCPRQQESTDTLDKFFTIVTNQEPLLWNANSEKQADLAEAEACKSIEDERSNEAHVESVQEVLPAQVLSKEANESKKARTCAICREILPSVVDCFKHYAEIHRYNPKPYKNIQGEPHRTTEGNQQCSFCGKFFRTENLDKHVHLRHIWHRVQRQEKRSGLGPVKCPLCEKEIKHAHNLPSHKARYHGQGKPQKNRKTLRQSTHKRQFVCEKCGYTTPEHRRLKNHLLTHEGKNAFNCSYCDYKTSDKSTFSCHLFRHRAEKRYKCEHCPYQCIQLKQLRAHLKHHHKIHLPKKWPGGKNILELNSLRESLTNITEHQHTQHPETSVQDDATIESTCEEAKVDFSLGENKEDTNTVVKDKISLLIRETQPATNTPTNDASHECFPDSQAETSSQNVAEMKALMSVASGFIGCMEDVRVSEPSAFRHFVSLEGDCTALETSGYIVPMDGEMGATDVGEVVVSMEEVEFDCSDKSVVFPVDHVETVVQDAKVS